MSDDVRCERCGREVETAKRLTCNGRIWGVFCVRCHDILADIALGETTGGILAAVEGQELPDDTPHCVKCGTSLSEGQPVSAVVERDDGSWQIAHLWDVDCAPTTIESVVEPILIEGDIAMVSDAARQRHYPTLVGVAIADRRQAVKA